MPALGFEPKFPAPQASRISKLPHAGVMAVQNVIVQSVMYVILNSFSDVFENMFLVLTDIVSGGSKKPELEIKRGAHTPESIL